LIFKENEDIVYFDSFEDCVEKVQYYSANHQERLKITQSGCNKVSKLHTTEARIKKLIHII
jgi:spore maturation protein CgeB